MMRLFLCEVRRQKRSIVDLCEHFAIRQLVQKEPIKMFFKLERQSREEHH